MTFVISGLVLLVVGLSGIYGVEVPSDKEIVGIFGIKTIALDSNRAFDAKGKKFYLYHKYNGMDTIESTSVCDVGENTVVMLQNLDDNRIDVFGWIKSDNQMSRIILATSLYDRWHSGVPESIKMHDVKWSVIGGLINEKITLIKREAMFENGFEFYEEYGFVVK